MLDSVRATVLAQETLQLYDGGRYLNAFEHLKAAGGLDALTGPSGRALAGRLAANLGAERYATSIHLRAWRSCPDANALAYFAAMGVAGLRGPVAALQLLDEADRQELTAYGASDLHSCRAYQYGTLRDFAQAEASLAAAFAATPDRPWLLVTEGYLLRLQDRPLEAIAVVRRALERRPFYRPAVQSLADLLVQQNEVDEAREVLTRASEQIQSGSTLLQLAQLERDMSLYESARERMNAALPMLPLRGKDRGSKGAYDGFAATLAYDVGQVDEAIRLGEESGTPFHTSVVESLRKNRETGKRVVLDVGFTLQRDMTCVPATLSTLTAYWGNRVSEVEIADAICYDGTPAHAERAWLEQQGYFCREFTLTWDVARQLIDAGLPFMQTLTGYAAGHMQAVIGYDSRRGVMIYRDPNVRHAGEVRAEQLIEMMRSNGPRGMVFVPMAQRQRVEQLDLPDHELWLHSHRVSHALACHQRDAAEAAYDLLCGVAPDHRLTLHARGRITSYDGDLRGLMEVTDRLLELFPKDPNQWAVKARLMQQLSTRAERLKVLEGLCGNTDVEVVYRHRLIEELLDDPRELSRVDYLLRRCRRSNAVDPQTMTLMARRAWIAKDRERALMWARYAACVELRSEERSSTYFAAASALGRSEEALAMLRDRFNRFARQDCGPTIGLIEGLDQVFKHEEALRVLSEALDARPDDGDLRMYGCNYLMRVGQWEKAREQLKLSKGRCHESAWLAAAARLAQQENRFEAAYDHLEQSLRKAPLSVGIHRQAAQVLADSKGFDAAIDHLSRYVDSYPQSIELRTTLVEISSQLGPETAEQACRDHLRHHADDAWGWRELGFKLVEQRRWNEASSAAERSAKYEPDAMQLRFLRGMTHLGVGEDAKAREEFLAALRVSVDYTPAMIELFNLCQTRLERRDALDEVLTELKKQVILGETLHLVRAQASRAYEPREALRVLEEARAARPELPQTRSAVVAQLISMDRLPDAVDEARGAVEQFPLLVAPRLDLADVFRAMGETTAEIVELRGALAIDSRSGQTLRLLAEAYARTGDEERELAMISRACQSEPRDVTHRGALAEFHWRRGDRDSAIETIRSAIEKDPAYEWGWGKLSEWAFVIGSPDIVVGMARAITSDRPKSVQAWLQRAELLSRFPEHAEETSNAIRRALELDPRSIDAHEHRAILLANHGRFDDAVAACAPDAFGDRVPMRLKARAAVIESQRGEIARAIDLMRGVVDADPDYAWAWSQLSQLLQYANEPEEALDAAKKLTELAPQAPASWGYVAECLASQGKLDEAKHHLKRSIELDPAYLYGGNALLSMQIDAEEYDGAAETLRTIGPQLSDHDRAAREARVWAMAGRPEESIDAMGRASRSATDSDELLREAVDAVLLAGLADPLKAKLGETIDQGHATTQAIAAFVEVLAREARISEIESLCDTLDPTTPHWAEAAAAYVDTLGDAQQHERLDAFVEPRRALLGRQSRSWGFVGAALQRSERFGDAIAWMSDWSDRPESEPHVLASLALSALHLCEIALVRDVVDRVISMPPAAATDSARVIGAAAEVFQGDHHAAMRRLKAVAPQNLSPYYSSLYWLLRAGVEGALHLDGGGRWREAWANWKTAFRQHFTSDGDDLYQSIVAHSRLLLAQRRGNPIHAWLSARQARRLRNSHAAGQHSARSGPAQVRDACRMT